MQARGKPERAVNAPLEALFRQILDGELQSHWRSYHERHAAPGETQIALLERLKVTTRANLAVLKLVAKEFVVLEAARPLLARERFVAQLGMFLAAAEPDAMGDVPLPPAVGEGSASSSAAAGPQARGAWSETWDEAAGPASTSRGVVPPSDRFEFRTSWQESEYAALPESHRPPSYGTVMPNEGDAKGSHASSAGEIAAHFDSFSAAPPDVAAEVPPVRTLPAEAETDGTLAPGTRLGKYVLGARIGQGAFGTVYASVHPLLRIPVAIKVMRSVFGDAEDRALFLGEARLIAQLNHPAVVRVWDFDDDERGRPYLVMEYVEGSTLADVIRTRGKLPAAAALAIGRRVAEGLQEAARLGIIHKDVKPGNILIARDGSVKLTDFGVAIVHDATLGELLSIRSKPGDISGTVYFMPPEQAQGDPIDARADMYALGVTLYQALTGRLPFVGKSTTHILLKQLFDTPIPPGDLVPGLPTAVSDLILKMMARTAADRPANYVELLRDFSAAEAAVALVPPPAEVALSPQDVAQPPTARLPQVAPATQAAPVPQTSPARGVRGLLERLGRWIAGT